MKTVLLMASCVFIAFQSSGQRPQEGYIMWPTDANTEKIVFSESVYRPATDASTLYAYAVKFARNAFKGEKDTIIQNDSLKSLTCRSAFFIPVEELGERGKGYIGFTFSIWCHKNSYRYLLTDLEHFAVKPDGVIGGPLENDKALSGPVLFPRRYWNEQKAKCFYRIQTTIERLKEAMSEEANG